MRTRRVGQGLASAVMVAWAVLGLGCGSESAQQGEDGADRSSEAPVQSPVSEESGATDAAEDEATDVSGPAPPPEGWVPDANDGPEGRAAQELIEKAIVILGPHRSSIYIEGDTFAVRVVTPTPHDAEVVDKVQSQTSIPVQLREVAISESWLTSSMERLNADMPTATIVFVNLEEGRLYASINRDEAPEVQDDVFAEQVRTLVASYLEEGRAAGSVAEGVTVDEAVGITEASAGF